MEILLNYVLPAVIIVLIIGAIIVYAVWLSRKMHHKTVDEDQRDTRRERKGITVAPYGQFLGNTKQKFHQALIKALPASYIIVPNVGVELLFKTGIQADLKLAGQYADFGIFTESWIPILLIFLVDYSPVGKPAFKVTPDIKELLNKISIRTLEYGVREVYSIDDLRKAIAKTMNPLYEK